MTHDQDVESTTMTDEQIMTEMDSAYWKAVNARMHPWKAAFAIAEKAIRERQAGKAPVRSVDEIRAEILEYTRKIDLPDTDEFTNWYDGYLTALEWVTGDKPLSLSAIRNKDASYVAPGS